jgi:uncharacterized YigZ family protein
MSFLTLSAPGRAELRVRGSSFIGHAAPAGREDEARAFLAERAREHFDATHNCSAWLLRDGTRRFNDDGEPSGSAGAPILAAIEGAALTDCVVVVTRYFGGTKLGVGGLVRAYGDAAAAVLQAAPVREGIPVVRLRIRFDYAHTAAVMRTLDTAETYEPEHGFAEGGTLGELRLSVPNGAEDRFVQALRDATAGSVHADPIGNGVVYRPREAAR